jgi:hypothetical protein
VTEYLNKFNYLARYSTHDVSTQERKIDRFLGGLNHTLRCQLSILDFPDFQALVNKALIVEREHKSVYEPKTGYDDRKRKFEPWKDAHEQFLQKPHTWQATQTMYKPAWNPSNNNNKMDNQDKPFIKRPVLEDFQRNNTCFACGQAGHYTKQCPTKAGKHQSDFKPQVNNIECHPK